MTPREKALNALLAGDLADVQKLGAVPDYVRRLVTQWESEAASVAAYDPATTSLTIAAQKYALAQTYKARAEAMRRRFPNAFCEGDRLTMQAAPKSERPDHE